MEVIGKNDGILGKIKEEELKKEDAKIPAGYAKIILSTQGQVGAPASFHIKNLNTRNALDLALSTDETLPDRLMEILNGLIWEDISVADFHEKEVIELMIRLFRAFYAEALEDIDFPIDASDYKFLEEDLDEEAYEHRVKLIETGKLVPKTRVLIESLETYDLAPDFNKYATIKNDEFSATFALPKFGDVRIIQDWSKSVFKEDEEKFNNAKKIIEIRNRMIDDYQDGKDIDLSRLPDIDSDIESQWQEFQKKKALQLVDAIRGLHLRKMDGVDYTDKPLSERIEAVQNESRLDITVAAKLDEYFEKLEFGIKPMVKMDNPITGKLCERRFSFRLVDIFQAIQAAGSDSYDIIPGEG